MGEYTLKEALAHAKDRSKRESMRMTVYKNQKTGDILVQAAHALAGLKGFDAVAMIDHDGRVVILEQYRKEIEA